MHSEQLRQGGDYDEALPVHSLVFSTADLPKFEAIPRHVHVCDIRMRGEPGDPEVVLTDAMGFVVVELGKFKARARDLPGPGERDAWCWLLKNSASMGRDEYECFINKGGEMAEAVKRLWTMSQDDELRAIAEAEQKQAAMRRSEMRTVQETSLEEGVEKGLKKGLKKGREEGREEGRMEIARKLFAKRPDGEDILRDLGLSAKELEILKAGR